MPGALPLRKTKKKSRGIVKRAALLLLALAALPVLEVGCSRFVNPPVTPEMVRFRLFSDNEAARKRGLRYEWMPLAEIPRAQVKMIWASEDQRFFKHAGIDFDEIRDAMKEAEKDGGPPRGASTITMQCARCLFLWQGRSWVRKGLEAYYTVLMELLLPKQRILELYLNVIEFGEGVYGVKAAAETFYGRPPADLSPAQMAMLAAVMPNPKEWDPRKPTARLRSRQQRVLRLERAASFPEKSLPPRKPDR